LDRYVERIIVLRQIFLRWDEKELGTVEVSKVSCGGKPLFEATRYHSILFNITMKTTYLQATNDADVRLEIMQWVG
jgi:hypothetical protein